MKGKFLLISLAMAGISYFFIMKGVITQDQSYHQFADQRTIFGIPNALDVLTNISFVIVGVLGLFQVKKLKDIVSTYSSWHWFFLSIALIGPGSAYYHWAPNDETLIWDRLPMSMGFMALYVALLTEHVSLKLEKLLPFGLFLGVLSVITWVITRDLRLYFIVQFSSFITVPLILLLFRSRYTSKLYYVGALLLYGLAKWAEVKDREIFELTHALMSGHSLKHLLAAAGLLLLWRMLKTRRTALARG